MIIFILLGILIITAILGVPLAFAIGASCFSLYGSFCAAIYSNDSSKGLGWNL